MAQAKQINQSMNGLEWGLLILLSIVWGGSFFFQGLAVKELPTFTIVTSRVALAAIILWTIMAVLGIKMPMSRQVWAAFLGMGLLNNVIPFCLIVWGQTHIASGLASILNATTPLFTLVVAQSLTADEKMTGPKLIGVALGIAGVAVIVGGDGLASLGVDVLAQLAVLGAALSYAFAAVFGRRFRAMELAPLATATGQITASSLILIPVMLLVDQPWNLTFPSGITMAALLGLAALSTALAYVIYFRILATAGATNLLLVTFLVPVSAVLLGLLLLNEQLQTKHMLGLILISLGLGAIDGRVFRLLRRPR